MEFIADESIDKKAEIVLETIKRHQDEFLSAFTVISPGIVRIRKK